MDDVEAKPEASSLINHNFATSVAYAAAITSSVAGACFAAKFASAVNLLVAASWELNQLALKPSVPNQMVLKPSDFKSSVAGEAVKVIPLATKLFKPTR